MGAHTLDRAAVQAATARCACIGRAAVEVHERVGSTNDRALELARGGAGEGALVVAAAQEAGRGRLGRRWASPPGGLYLSLALRPDEAMLRRLPVTLLGGLAVLEGVEAALMAAGRPGDAADLALKWPNDVHLAGRKLAGVLGELSHDAQGPLLVLGLGINVETAPDELPGELRPIATTLGGPPPSRAEVLSELLPRFEALYQAVRQGGGAEVLARASARMPVLGRRVRVRLAERTIEGLAAGLNATGALLVALADGRQEVVVAGDVEEVGQP